MLAEGLVNLLLSDGPTVAILGMKAARGGTTGIFAGSMPEGTVLPAIVYVDVHAADEMTLDGPDAFTMQRMQFSCYGNSYADAKRLAAAVRNAFESVQGALSDGSQVDSIHRVGEMDAFEDAPFSYATHLDFEAAYRDPSVTDVVPPFVPGYPTSGPRRYAIGGAMNGSNTNFTLPGNPDPAVLVIVWNGLQMNPSSSYTLGTYSGGVTPLTTSFAPGFGDDFYAIF
jgi:hypothetical protein